MNDKKWDIDYSFFEKRGRKEFADKLKQNKSKSTKAIRLFFHNLSTEAKETQDASKILIKYIKKGKLNKEEENELKTQVYDLLKIMGIGVPFFMIPGSTLLIPFLLKVAEKRGIDILPSAFSKDNDLKIDNTQDKLKEE